MLLLLAIFGNIPTGILLRAPRTLFHISSDNLLSFDGEFDFWKQLIVTWNYVCGLYLGDVWGKEWGVKTMEQDWFSNVAHKLFLTKRGVSRIFWTLGAIIKSVRILPSDNFKCNTHFGNINSGVCGKVKLVPIVLKLYIVFNTII